MISVLTGTFLIITASGIKAFPRECEQLGVNFYEITGCKADQQDPSSCPTSYDCPKYEVGKCIVGGRQYQPGERIKGVTNCYFCTCPKYQLISAGSNLLRPLYQFPCAQPMCMRVNLTEGCYIKQDLDSCCGSSQFCPDETTYKCVVDGQTYLENQRIYPKDSCYECVCKPGFELFKEPFCKRSVCNIEIKDPNSLADKCTPYYEKRLGSSKVLCCPQGYICENDLKKTTVISAGSEYLEATCSIGGLKLPLQSSISVEFLYRNKNINATCSCQVGPYFTCIAD